MSMETMWSGFIVLASVRGIGTYTMSSCCGKSVPFRQAQQIWADYLGMKDVEFHRGRSENIPEPDAEPEPDDTVGFLEPEEPDDQIKATLAEAAGFYNELLLSDSEKYSKVLTYLARRALESPIIETISDRL
jgi:DNA primase